MRVLLVEDNLKTLSYLQQGLSENNFIVDTAQEGQTGLFLAENDIYDLIILDVMMPKIDGWSLIKKLREKNRTVPVLFLTARDELNDKIKGFELGADDYLVKPFAFSELLVRMRALIRRKNSAPVDVLQVADLKLDPIKHKAIRGENLLQLTQKEFLLLSLLMKKTGEALSRTLIAEQVWDINFDSDTNVIDVAIKRLRAKVDGDSEKKLIHTIRGVGYVLEER